MKNYLKGFGIVLLLIVTGLGVAKYASASAYDWHLSLRNSADTVDVPFELNVGVNNRDRMVAVNGSTLQPILFDFGEDFWWDHDNLQLRLNDLGEGKISGLIGHLATLSSGIATLSSQVSDNTSNIVLNSAYISNLNSIIGSSTVQKIRAQTDTSGVYTWTFPQSYATSTVPIVEITVEDGTSGAVWNHRITAISSTSVSVQITKSTSVTILGISVLGVAASPQAFVHLTAMKP